MKRFLSLALALIAVALLCSCRTEKKKTEIVLMSKASESEEPNPLNALLKVYGFCGVVSVTQNGKEIYRQSSNPAKNSGDVISPDSLFCIGSVSKQFAAAAVLQLQDKGLLSTSDTLDKYFPECPYGGEVTLRQMLSMRSGIAEFYDVENSGGCANELPRGSLRGEVTNDNTIAENREKLTAWLFEQPLDYTPGSEYRYTNSNYFLLAQIVEKVSGERYEDYMKAHIFEPLGMKNTGFIDEMMSDPGLVKSPHEAKTVYVGITMGLGDMISCADDMDRWLASFSGNKILSSPALKEMSENYSAKDGGAYGYGVIPNGKGGLSHSGFFTSYSAFVFVIPEKNYRFFAVTNDMTAMSDDLSKLSSKLILKTMK